MELVIITNSGESLTKKLKRKEIVKNIIVAGKKNLLGKNNNIANNK